MYTISLLRSGPPRLPVSGDVRGGLDLGITIYIYIYTHTHTY